MKILRCWCSNPTGGKLFAINLLFTMKQYKVDNIVNFVYYGKTRIDYELKSHECLFPDRTGGDPNSK